MNEVVKKDILQVLSDTIGILKVEEESHNQGLTDKIKDFLEKGGKKWATPKDLTTENLMRWEK